MNTGAFGENFPYSNFHDLNMDWIIKIAKDFLDQYTHIQEVIANGEQSLQDLTASGIAQLNSTAEELEAGLQAWYDTHSADIQNELTTALTRMNTELTSLLNTLRSSAESIGEEVLASIPDDYTELSDKVNLLYSTNTGLLDKQASFDPSRNLNYFDDGSPLSGDGWFNNYLYSAGFIKSITFRTDASASGYVTFVMIDPVTMNVIDKIDAWFTNSQDVTFPVNRAYKQEMYIGIVHSSGVDVNYKSNTDVQSSYFTASNINIGQPLTGVTQYGTYEFPFVVNYERADINIGTLLAKNFGQTSIMSINNIPIDSITGTPSTSWWGAEFHYKAGYVKSIRVTKSSASAIAEIAFVDTVTNKVVFKGATATNSSVISVEQYFPNDFYIFSKYVCYMLAYTSYQRYNNNTDLDALQAGSDFTPTFSDGRYIFANELTYELVPYDNLSLKITDRNRMFACGDSITAGFPYIANNPPYRVNEDIRWGRQVARRLGFDITFGASSGNGWVYSTGSANAYTITRDTDFSQYHVAVYAWGTNDYGHSSALGDITDDPSQVLTVCSRVKWCINKIFTDNPGIVLIIVLPINRMTGTQANNYAYGTANEAGYTLSDLCEKIKEICVMYGIPYIDPRVSPFNRYSIDGLTTDGLHPNYAGYKVLGSYLTGQIENIITPYYADAYSVK